MAFGAAAYRAADMTLGGSHGAAGHGAARFFLQ